MTWDKWSGEIFVYLTQVNKAFCSEGDIEVLTKGLTDNWIKVDKYWMYLVKASSESIYWKSAIFFSTVLPTHLLKEPTVSTESIFWKYLLKVPTESSYWKYLLKVYKFKKYFNGCEIGMRDSISIWFDRLSDLTQ